MIDFGGKDAMAMGVFYTTWGSFSLIMVEGGRGGFLSRELQLREFLIWGYKNDNSNDNNNNRENWRWD